MRRRFSAVLYLIVSQIIYVTKIANSRSIRRIWNEDGMLRAECLEIRDYFVQGNYTPSSLLDTAF
jgi:hypothetical protein